MSLRRWMLLGVLAFLNGIVLALLLLVARIVLDSP